MVISIYKQCREVSERFKVQSWKGCVGAIPPRVRIPSSLISPSRAMSEFADGWSETNPDSEEIERFVT